MTADNMKAEPIKEYYIAYFDLLGYKEFFRNYPDKVENFLQVIYEAISLTTSYTYRKWIHLLLLQISEIYLSKQKYFRTTYCCVWRKLLQT